MEPLGAILGRLGANLGGLGATFGALRVIIIFWSDFYRKKGAQREAFWEPKQSKHRSNKRGAHLKANMSPLAVVLVRFGVDFQGVLGSTMLFFFHWF